MENIKKDKNKMYMIGGVIFFVLVLVVGFFIMNGSKSEVAQSTTQNVLPESEIIPTIDSSVKVDVKAQNLNHEVVLTIDGIPAGTTEIEYELSYLAKKTLPKGAMGTIEVTGNSIKRTITLGTCSSGTCVYDEGVESVEVSLKFNSASGSKSFKKEFPL